GVSLLTPDGQIGRLISGFPSTRDAGDLAGVPLVALAPDNSRIYVGNFGAGHLWVLPLTPEQQKNGLTLPAAPFTADDLDVAMERLNNVMLVNPFDMTFDPQGVPVVTDASGNGVAKETPDGKTRFFHRFAELPNPDKPWDPIEAVPTGILRVDNPDGSREYLVTLTGGCPYPEGAGQLVAVDEQRHQRTLIEGLNMPIDVARSLDGTLWLLEFARFTKDASCFTGEGYQPKTGRLSRILPDWTLEPVLTELNYPGAVLPARDGSLYISEVLTGRILRVTFGKEEGAAEPEDISLRPTPTPGPAPSFTDLDAALAEVLARQGLQPHPGVKRREADTPLARLGQAFFFDPILSGDKNVSCATCHHPRFAMADARVLPIGAGGDGLGPERDFAEWVTLGPEASAPRRLQAVRNDAGDRVPNPFAGQFVPRNSPTVINAALFPVQFWDGRVDGSADGPVRTLEEEINRLGMTDPLAVQALFPPTSMHEMAGATLGGLAPETIRRTLLARL
ncbi:MAG: ScyD/ScyE family protein, partial [Caldilineae bacterium]